MNKKKKGHKAGLEFHHVDIVLPNGILPKSHLVVREGKIANISSSHSEQIWDLKKFSKKLLVPGFFDIQNNGGKGIDLSGGIVGRIDLVREWAKHNLQYGITTLLATCISNRMRRMQGALKTLSTFCFQNDLTLPETKIFLEGPFINPKFRGVHLKKNIQKPNLRKLQILLNSTHGDLVLIALAPELNRISPLVKNIIEMGIIPAIGHSGASDRQTSNFFKKGANFVVHLFNGMPKRENKSLISEALKSEYKGIKIGLIADGLHVPPEKFLSVIEQLKSSNRISDIVLVTDSNSGQGMKKDFKGVIAGQSFKVKNGKALTEKGKLAGSVITLPKAIQNIRKWDHGVLKLHELINMVSLNPASLLNLENKKGKIEKGMDADLVLIDDQGGRFKIKKVYRKGNQIF